MTFQKICSHCFQFIVLIIGISLITVTAVFFINPNLLNPFVQGLSNGSDFGVQTGAKKGLQISARKAVQKAVDKGGKTVFNKTTKYVLRTESITLCSFDEMTKENYDYADLKLWFNDAWVGDFSYNKENGRYVYRTKRIDTQFKQQIFLNNVTNQIDLKLAKVQNEGEYRCEVDHGPAELVTPFRLEIVVLPKITVTPATILEVGKNKSTFVAQCHAEGARPKAELEWDYSSFSQKPELLRFKEFVKHDQKLPTQTTTNDLHFKLENHHNNKKVICKLKPNNAWRMVKEPARYQKTASLELDVQFRPETPVINMVDKNKVSCSAAANPQAKYRMF